MAMRGRTSQSRGDPYCHLPIASIPLVRWFCSTFPRSRHLVVSNGATAVKGAWSGAEGVHRSEAETLDGRGSGVARLAVGGGEVCVFQASEASGGMPGGSTQSVRD